MPSVELNLCPKLPEVSDDLQITLPFGGAMKAIRDISQGIPNDCTMTFNLLTQLQPLLGGMDSVLKMLPTWKFSPGKILGEPVSSWVVTTIRFELK